MLALQKNKRRLLDSHDESFDAILHAKRSRKVPTINEAPAPPLQIRDDEICARLVTTTQAGRREAVLISIEKPVTIGRNGSLCTYVIQDAVVSNIHFKVYALRSSSGAVLLTCQDSSTNGIKLNEHLIKKTSVILTHGDVLKIPSSQTFQCIYTIPAMRSEKRTLFDPTPPLAPVDKIVGKYRVTSCTLGSGSYATVNLAYTVSSSKGTSTYVQVACKMLNMTGETERSKLMREVELLKEMNHPNINHILDIVVKDGFLNIFLDLSTGGDLFTYIGSRPLGRMKEGEARYCGFQLMLGLQYLHERNVSHRDVKPENILLHSPGPFPRLIIADFGLARARAHEHTLNAVGTICYMPPEAILALATKKVGYVGIYADAWSLGLVLYTMLCGYHPFDYDAESTLLEHTASDCSDALVKSRIVDNPVTFQDTLWKGLPDARDLIGQLLIHNPKHRETVKGALNSKWILVEIDDLKDGYRDRVGPCS